jgi:multidrug transporter EmrE-like cation transporter
MQLFFGLNLLFNAIMWGLFTRALTLATSTVRVSVINTSANFMLTAVLGALIFSESLPGLWWLGAALLVAGSVIIGMREEGNKTGVEATTGIEPLLDDEGDSDGFRDGDERDEDVELRTVKDDSEEGILSEDEDGVLK